MAGQFVIKQIAQDVISETVQPLYIGGVNPNGSDAKLTVNTDGTMTGASALALPSLTVASKPVASNLLAEYTVTGSAVTSIDFSGLDINTHKSYRIEVNLINATASGGDIYLYVNGLTSTYYYQLIYTDGTSIYVGRDVFAKISNLPASGSSNAWVNVSLVNSYPSYTSFHSTKLGTTAPATTYISTTKTATVTNITQLTFTCSVANAIGVGSTVRIYRGDV